MSESFLTKWEKVIKETPMPADLRSDETKFWHGQIDKAVALERERCAKIADDMRIKHGSPTGDTYSNGVWDQGVRIASFIRGNQQAAPLVHVGGDGEAHDGPRAECQKCSD